MAIERISTETAAETPRAEIPPLTSLRFIAATMIVWCHASFGLQLATEMSVFGLVQGVSLFFVLSGFVLTYRYGSGFADWKDVVRFLGARVARIWPAHAATNVLLMLSLPWAVWLSARPATFFGIATLNFLMLHSLLPGIRYYSSLNSPSWSISTEFCFYALFPFLLQVFNRKWYECAALCLFALLASLTLAFFCSWFPENIGIVRLVPWLITINPLARLFEFLLGMLACKAFLKYSDRFNGRFILVTAIELAAIAILCTAVMLASALNDVFLHSTNQFIRPLAFWASLCDGSMPVALLIFALALQNGLVARLLNFSYLVKLGDISYSVYLLHYPVLLWFQVYGHDGPRLEAHTTVLAYWVVLIVAARTMHKYVEMPARKSIRNAIDQTLPSKANLLWNLERT